MPKKIVFLNIETTGLLPKNTVINKENIDKFPYLQALHLKWGYYDKKNKKVIIDNSLYTIIKPDNFEIPNYVTKIHGITPEIANTKGSNIKLVLNKFIEIIKDAYSIISYQTVFRLKCLKVELMRHNFECNFDKYKIIDLYDFNHNYNYPKLEDLYYNLYDKQFKKSHPRKSNINIMIKCFEYLYNKYIDNIKESDMKIPPIKKDKVTLLKRKSGNKKTNLSRKKIKAQTNLSSP